MTDFTNTTPFLVATFNRAVIAAEKAARQEAKIDQRIAMDHGSEVTRWEVENELLQESLAADITDPEIADAYRAAYIAAWGF